MTRQERAVFLVAALACAATRVLAIAKSPWDRDEVLFALALREYDVASHHPHPPGYPLFIALAKLFGDDFRALQAVTFLAAVLVFPAVYLFARRCGSTFATSISAGLLCAFFPNVWFFGGSGFSDVPAMVLVTFAAATSSAALLGCAIAIRPQNALVLFRPKLRGVIAGAVIVAVAYGAAVYATGDRFGEAMRLQSEYLRRTDSFLNPDRPSLVTMAERFFLKPYGPSHISIVLSLFVVIALARRRGMKAVLTFGPIAIFAWLMLDRFSSVRYAIGYAPMLAVLAAEGIAVTAKKFAPYVTGAIVLFSAIVMIPSFPRDVSPPVAAVQQAKTPLYVAQSMTEFVDLLRPGLPYVRVLDHRALVLSDGGWLLADVTREGKGTLWQIARRQNFDVRVMPARTARFEGWEPPQREGHMEFRRLRGRGLVELPPATGETSLRLRLGVDGRFIVKLNGRVLDDRVASGDIESDHVVVPQPENILEIISDREFGVRLQALSWGPA